MRKKTSGLCKIAPTADDELVKLLKAGFCKGGLRDGGMTSHEMSVKLGICQSATINRLRTLVMTGALEVCRIRGTDMCGRVCSNVVYKVAKK
jgi:hypothetical protein